MWLIVGTSRVQRTRHRIARANSSHFEHFCLSAQACPANLNGRGVLPSTGSSLDPLDGAVPSPKKFAARAGPGDEADWPARRRGALGGANLVEILLEVSVRAIRGRLPHGSSVRRGGDSADLPQLGFARGCQRSGRSGMGALVGGDASARGRPLRDQRRHRDSNLERIEHPRDEEYVRRSRSHCIRNR